MKTSTYTTCAFTEYLKIALPTPVQEKLEDVVGLGSMTWEMQREHLTHYTEQHRAAKEAKKEEMEMIGLNLMRKQLAILEEMELQQAPPQMMKVEVYTQLQMNTCYFHK